jgi:hypothetical protein
MIKNERQYRITKAQAEKFERALEKAQQHPIDSSEVDTVIRDAITAGMQSQLDDLRAQLHEYEALHSGREAQQAGR